MPILYFKPTCPFSQKVLQFIAANGLREQVEFRDIAAEPQARQELEELTGRHQVPCLVVNGTPLLDSQRIITWLEQNYRTPTNAAS